MMKQLIIKMIGLFVNRFVQSSTTVKEDGRTSSENMKNLCRQAAGEGCVLLKNEGVLPLLGKAFALFGRVQCDSFFSGYGSGGDIKPPYKISFLEGIKESGLNYDKETASLYEEWCHVHRPYDGFWGFWPLGYDEMKVSEDVVRKAAEKEDTAVYVLGRSSGEDRDNKIKRGGWYLTRAEERMICLLKKHFAKICVMINSGAVIDMSWVEKYSVDAVLYCWQGGQEMGRGAADILSGRTNPCGRLSCTIADIHEYPSTKGFGSRKRVEYKEDIYVGYRYFYTFAREKIAYPFGFGLSYTTFSIEMMSFKDLTMEVRVTNTGNMAGKEVVQLYCRAPQGKLGKSDKALVAFEKTPLLQPEESCSIMLRFDKKSLSSFDDTGQIQKYAFVLEKGIYEFLLGNSSLAENVAACYEAEEDEVLEQLEEVCGVKRGFKRLVNSNGRVFRPVEESQEALKERMLSRLPMRENVPSCCVTWKSVVQGEAQIDDFVFGLSEDDLEHVVRGSDWGMYDPHGTGGNAGIIGGTAGNLRKIGLPVISTCDGASGVRCEAHSSLIPIETMLACTFDKELVRHMAFEMGKEMKDIGLQVLLAPNINIQRNPLCGRNFEYFSEDPYHCGEMGKAFVNGIQSAGVSATVKHFAANNQESWRHTCDSVVSQRALREIYLRQFEIVIREAGPDCLMMSYNKLNGVLNCFQYDLATTVLRREWNYQGLVMTDWWMDYETGDEFEGLERQACRVRAGVDLYMPGSDKTGRYKGRSDGSLQKGLRSGNLTKEEVRKSASRVLALCKKYSGDTTSAEIIDE